MGQTDTTVNRQWPCWLNATLLLIASFIGIAGLSFQARPGAEIVAVAFPVWWDLSRPSRPPPRPTPLSSA